MAGSETSADRDYRSQQHHFITGAGRGMAGALLFALPMLMTMEMWSLGVYMGRGRLLVLLIVNIPLLVLLAHHIGFEKTFSWRNHVRDAAIAYGIGILVSAVVLAVFNVLAPGMPVDGVIGKIALQSVPASIGAMLARSQLGHADAQNAMGDDDTVDTRYASELFMMAVGALFLGLNIAPTDEMQLLSYKMTPWHGLALLLLTIFLMHGFVYAVSFVGGHELSPETPRWHAFVRFTLPGYVLTVLINLYVLWTFEQLGDATVTQLLLSLIVLGFPGAIGAAAARLIL